MNEEAERFLREAGEKLADSWPPLTEEQRRDITAIAARHAAQKRLRATAEPTDEWLREQGAKAVADWPPLTDAQNEELTTIARDHLARKAQERADDPESP